MPWCPSSSHVWMWELDHKESWALKNWCFWTMVLEKTLESPLDCKEIQPVHPKGDQSCVFTGRTDARAETPIFWPPNAKSWLIWKEPDAGKDWDQEEKGMTGWGGWMASTTQWTWVWVNSGSWWWTGKPDVVQSTGSRRVGHHWETELNWTESFQAQEIIPSAFFSLSKAIAKFGQNSLLKHREGSVLHELKHTMTVSFQLSWHWHLSLTLLYQMKSWLIILPTLFSSSLLLC